jgi:hypothetical protein
VETLDAMHDLPKDAPEVAIVLKARLRSRGSYEVDYESSPVFRRISVRPGIHDPRTTLVHEVGHLLDEAVLSPYPRLFGSASIGDVAWDRWNAAVAGTPTFGRLRKRTLRFRRRVTTLMEYWARSYEQYVVLASDDLAMQEEFRQTRRIEPLYWPDNEFGPIFRAVEGLLEARQLLR